jgi:hypothetical protein
MTEFVLDPRLAADDDVRGTDWALSRVLLMNDCALCVAHTRAATRRCNRIA